MTNHHALVNELENCWGLSAPASQVFSVIEFRWSHLGKGCWCVTREIYRGLCASWDQSKCNVQV